MTLSGRLASRSRAIGSLPVPEAPLRGRIKLGSGKRSFHVTIVVG